jgi:hypothetical protein
VFQCAIVGGAILIASPTAGQLQYGFDAVWNSRYEWRGLTLRNGMVLQPDAFIAIGGRTTLTVGAWTNIELTTPNEPNDVAFSRTFLGETNLWTEAALIAGPAELALGWNWLHYNAGQNAFVPGGGFATHEIYARVGVADLPFLVPVLSYYQDVDQVNGGYVEGELSMRLPLWTQVEVPIGSIWITAAGGYNVSQDGLGLANRYQERGPTHFELATSTTIGYTPISLFESIHANVSLHIGFHLQWNLDDATKFSGNTQRLRDTWLTLGISWAGPRCEPTRTIC